MFTHAVSKYKYVQTLLHIDTSVCVYTLPFALCLHLCDVFTQMS